jgi:S1-C subfamily serine protease
MHLSRSTALAVSLVASVGAIGEVSAEQSLPDLAETALKSVVRVQTFDEQGEPLVSGSAFFISEDGRLVTNYHLVEGASSAVVHLSIGAVFGVDGVLGVSEANDLAVLKISGDSFPPLELGEGTGLRVGQQVVAIGNPLGREGTVSSGIVSAIRSGDDCEGLALRCIQTTAPVSPGSSGGPLLNMEGKVIGVTSALVPGGQSLNFAVSVDLLASLLSERQSLQDLSALHTPSFLGTAPTKWASTADGTEWLIRRLDGTIYAERLVTGDLAERGFSTVCEYEYRGAERAWQGLCRVRAPVECSSRWRVCAFEVPDALVSVKPERITGISLAPQDLDCATCSVTSSEWTDFTLLPKQVPPDALERSSGPPGSALPAEPDPLRADIQGRVMERSEQSWAFSWALSLTSTYSSPLTAEATIQFLDADGLVIASRTEPGLQVPANSSVTFRGVAELEPSLAAEVERLGVKVQAKTR